MMNTKFTLTAYRTSDGEDGEVEALKAERERMKADPVEADKIRAQAQRLADPDAVSPAEALLSRLEWSASTPDLACCPLCSQKMDDGHSGDCGFAVLAKTVTR